MPSLSNLRNRLRKRKTKRDAGARRYRKTGKGARSVRAHVRAIRKLRDLIRREIARRPKSGTGPWAGTKSIVDVEVVPVAKRYGVPTTSRKRAANHPLTIANPSSDHAATNTTAYAIDFGTYSGEDLAVAIAKALGISGYSVGNYDAHYIERAGSTFRVQILWAVEAHFDHVHVGIKAA